MAFISDAPRTSFFQPVVDGLARFLDRLATSRIGEKRMERMQRLNAMSDAQLADLGIRREDIARIVFPDMLYM